MRKMPRHGRTKWWPIARGQRRRWDKESEAAAVYGRIRVPQRDHRRANPTDIPRRRSEGSAFYFHLGFPEAGRSWIARQRRRQLRRFAVIAPMRAPMRTAVATAALGAKIDVDGGVFERTAGAAKKVALHLSLLNCETYEASAVVFDQGFSRGGGCQFAITPGIVRATCCRSSAARRNMPSSKACASAQRFTTSRSPLAAAASSALT